MFGIGTPEIIFLVVIGAIVLFFGKGKVKEWLSIGKEIKAEANETKIESNKTKATA